MKNPLRTEAEAFSFVLVVAVCFCALALAAVLGGTWVALSVFLALVLGFTVGVYMKTEPRVREQAVWERSAPDGRRRVLVIANETVAGEALREEIRHRAEPGTEVLVVIPALNTQLRHWTSDEDAARGEAAARLDGSLAALAELGVDARGTVGDADPLQALEDALRTFRADELIVSTHPPGRSNWLEKGLVTRARERFPLPVTHVVVDMEHEQARATPKAAG